MIVLENVSKSFYDDGVRRTALQDVSATFERGRTILIFGPRYAGKTTLLGVLNGTIKPDSGRIDRTESVSFPVGMSRSFWRDLTFRQNIRAVATMHGAEPAAVIERVRSLARIGAYMDKAVRDAPRELQVQFSFALSLGLGFDFYAFDESAAPADPDTRFMIEDFIHAHRHRCGFFILTRRPQLARQYCDDDIYTLNNGRLLAHDTVEDAIRAC